ncbi:hypothetical protein B0T14DRAFT_569081 [Immersiella caudata]|uniref:Uncharacterized protein n=1 Tax=Immersiella caudata TaxID=314043 RepID=A0AA39WLG2_9PEZI|nr:hypothetical protein B0T14DRAFT_569081 [Immersiella caudata]
MAQATSLWDLPAQALPSYGGLVGPVFTVIWFCASIAFWFAFHTLLRTPGVFDRKRPTWDEFKAIAVGTGLLASWYFFCVIDRWIHHDLRPVEFGYILVLPFFEILKIASSLILIMGTFTVVWKDLEPRFPKNQQGKWWFASKMLLFFTGLMGLYSWVLKFSLAIVWMRFASLNAIADVATKRTQCEIAMCVFFFVFGLMTVAASSGVLIKMLWNNARLVGDRIVLSLATLMLFLRSTVELGTAAKAYSPDHTRMSLLVTNDVAFGLLTMLYLSCMFWHAWRVTSDVDMGSEQPELVSAFIRFRIVEQLNHMCEPGRESPALRDALELLRMNLTAVVSDERLVAATRSLSEDDRRKFAEDCLRDVDTTYGKLDPAGGVNADSLRTRTPFSMLSRLSRASHRSQRQVKRESRRENERVKLGAVLKAMIRSD